MLEAARQAACDKSNTYCDITPPPKQTCLCHCSHNHPYFTDSDEETWDVQSEASSDMSTVLDEVEDIPGRPETPTGTPVVSSHTRF